MARVIHNIVPRLHHNHCQTTSDPLFNPELTIHNDVILINHDKSHGVNITYADTRGALHQEIYIRIPAITHKLLSLHADINTRHPITIPSVWLEPHLDPPSTAPVNLPSDSAQPDTTQTAIHPPINPSPPPTVEETTDVSAISRYHETSGNLTMRNYRRRDIIDTMRISQFCSMVDEYGENYSIHCDEIDSNNAYSNESSSTEDNNAPSQSSTTDSTHSQDQGPLQPSVSTSNRCKMYPNSCWKADHYMYRRLPNGLIVRTNLDIPQSLARYEYFHRNLQGHLVPVDLP